MNKLLVIFTSLLSLIFGTSSNLSVTAPKPAQITMLKDVGEAYMDHFGLAEEDFKKISEAGFNLIEGNFDICASDEDVLYFLDMSAKYNLQVILPAGAGEAEWGYECDKQTYPVQQKPVWDTEGVREFIINWKDHPALYGWDTSNEAGSTFPNSERRYYLDKDQLKVAYKDVKSWDPDHPIMIRMNGWFFYDYESNFIRTGNPFDSGVADIVMVNAYSNVEDYYPDFVSTVTYRAIDTVGDTKLIVALGVWEEPPLWYLPSIDQLNNDKNQLDDFDILGVAYFKYGAKNSEWYLPESAPNLWKQISN